MSLFQEFEVKINNKIINAIHIINTVQYKKSYPFVRSRKSTW